MSLSVSPRAERQFKSPSLPLRKTLIALGGIAIAAVSFLFAQFVGWRIISFLVGNGARSQAGSSAIYRFSFGDIYTDLSFIVLSFVAGVSFVLAFWEPRRWKLPSNITYWFILAVVLPLSIANFATGDFFIARWKQALIDVLLVFCGSVAVIELVKLSLVDTGALVLRAMVVFALVLFAVSIPGIYALLFAMNAVGLMSIHAIEHLQSGWVSALAGTGSFVVALLKFLQERKDKAAGR